MPHFGNFLNPPGGYFNLVDPDELRNFHKSEPNKLLIANFANPFDDDIRKFTIEVHEMRHNQLELESIIVPQLVLQQLLIEAVLQPIAEDAVLQVSFVVLLGYAD